MVTGTPDSIGTVVGQIVKEMGKLAEQQGESLGKILADAERQAGAAVTEIRQLPDDVVDKIKELTDPPNWWSVLVFAMVQLSKVDDRLKAGTLKIDGWSRMVALTDDAAPDARFTIGLALTDPDTRKGILLAGKKEGGHQITCATRDLVVLSDWTVQVSTGGTRLPDLVG